MLKKVILLFIILIMLPSIFSCAVDSKDEARYISGMYTNEDLDVGYSFFSDGKGYQFILEYVYLIKYEIIGDYITITTLSEESDTTAAFTFKQNTDSIIINGVTYVLVEDLVSEGMNTTSD
ncbi:MAG: hypothetical protein A2Y15_07535 [Clostridiales bacterium GWF2_36_10]|nr:MAG: hypothetical protein A2Y15_07535 [Clostridiales bacterium GWF2_36_10]